MERYDDQSGNNLWKRAAAPADLPDRSGERAGHGLLPGVRDAFFRVSISKSRRAAESGPHACRSGVGPRPRSNRPPCRLRPSPSADLAHGEPGVPARPPNSPRTREAPVTPLFLGGARLVLMSPTEAPSDDALYNQMIGGAGNIHTRSEIKLPVRRTIKVNHRKDLLRLLGNR